MPNVSVVLNTFTAEYSGCILSIQQRRQPLFEASEHVSLLFFKKFCTVNLCKRQPRETEKKCGITRMLIVENKK